MLKAAVFLSVNGDATGPEGVAIDPGQNSRHLGAPLDHLPDVHAVERFFRELSGAPSRRSPKRGLGFRRNPTRRQILVEVFLGQVVCRHLMVFATFLASSDWTALLVSVQTSESTSQTL